MCCLGMIFRYGMGKENAPLKTPIGKARVWKVLIRVQLEKVRFVFILTDHPVVFKGLAEQPS